MKYLVLALAASLSLAACATAQTNDQTAAPTATEAAAKTTYTLDTPIETLVADPATKAILERELPGLTTHAMYNSFKSMSLKQLQPLSGGLLTDARLTAVDAALKQLAAGQ